MSKEQEEKIDKEELNTQNTSEETTETATEAQADAAAEEATEEETEGDNAQKSAEESLDDKINKLTEDLEKANKEYLFLLAEFDNFRKRTVREKADIIRNAGEKVLGQLLPIIDDFVQRFSLSDFIVVADSGLLSRKNITLLKAAGNKPMTSKQLSKALRSSTTNS